MSERLFRTLVRLYPEVVRREHGDEFLEIMRARRRRTQGLGVALLWLRLVLDTAWALPRSYWDERRRSGGSRLGPAMDDVRQAVRSLRRHPASSAAIIACFALGFSGLTTALSFYYGALVRPLPFQDPSRLAVLFSTSPGFTRASPSYADFVAWRDQTRAFSSLAAYTSANAALAGPEGPERETGSAVTFGFFQILGVGPALGRGPSEDEDRPDVPATVVLSHALWRDRFSSDPGVVGETVVMDGEPAVVIGIMPADFDFPAGARFWTSMRRSSAPGASSGLVRGVLGRLSPGRDLEAARAEMRTIARRLQLADPAGHADRDIGLRALPDDLVWGWEGPVSGFLLVTLLILLLALGNVAHLLLARSTVRTREMVIRSALGASRTHLARQLAVEGVILSVVGGAVGLGLGVLGRDLYLLWIPTRLPSYLDFSMGRGLLAVLFAFSLSAGLLAGLVPALDTIRRDLLSGLKEGGALKPKGGLRRLGRPALVGAQAGLALVVIMGAGTAARSFIRLNRISTGFDGKDLLTLHIALPPGDREDEDRQRVLFDRIRNRAAALPGVESAAAVSNLPVGGMAAGTYLTVEHSEPPEPGHEPWIVAKTIQPGYLEAMRIPLSMGRAFSPSDGAPGGSRVVIVNEAFARRYWPGESPLGKRVKYGGVDSQWPWMAVVGVAGDVRNFGRGRPVELGIYEPFRQSPHWRMYLTARVKGEPGPVAMELRRAVQQASPGSVVYDVRTMDDILYEDQWHSVVYARLLTAFALLALALAALGLFGVVSFSTARRAREFGVRIALGARRRSVLASATHGLAIPIAAGLTVGIAVSVVLVPRVGDIFYDSPRLDPMVATAAVSLLLLVAAAATYLPARRALQVDPVRTLRAEQ